MVKFVSYEEHPILKTEGAGKMRKPWKHKKAAVLALCVSLWMAGGSVAGAVNTTVDDTNAPGEFAGGAIDPYMAIITERQPVYRGRLQTTLSR